MLVARIMIGACLNAVLTNVCPCNRCSSAYYKAVWKTSLYHSVVKLFSAG